MWNTHLFTTHCTPETVFTALHTQEPRAISPRISLSVYTYRRNCCNLLFHCPGKLCMCLRRSLHRNLVFYLQTTFCSPRGNREPSQRTEYYYSAYLRNGTGIGVQYYIYCSPIPVLQTGIGLKALRGGHKNALGSSAPTSRRQQSDVLRAASSVDKSQSDCNLKRGISRLHR